MFFSKKKKKKYVGTVKRSNVIQYDSMGYPLRLVINVYGEQIWLDTVHEEGDIVLLWKDY